jgi:hypothetical protein
LSAPFAPGWGAACCGAPPAGWPPPGAPPPPGGPPPPPDGLPLPPPPGGPLLPPAEGFPWFPPDGWVVEDEACCWVIVVAMVAVLMVGSRVRDWILCVISFVSRRAMYSLSSPANRSIGLAAAVLSSLLSDDLGDFASPSSSSLSGSLPFPSWGCGSPRPMLSGSRMWS